MITGLDIVKRALKHINSYQSGEQIAPADAQDVLDQTNSLLQLASTNKWSVFGSNENIFAWNVGQNQYKIGNPKCTDIGLSVFTGTVTSGSNVITGVTQIPSGLFAGTSSSYNGAGSMLTDLQNLFPANTYCTAFNVGAQTVTMNAPATANSQGLDQITYTLPGDFPIPRPLRITQSYTRINQLDFYFDVYGTQEEYNDILYKAQPGPWPIIGWYNNQYPYGILNVYQTPGQGATVHLFTDTILADLSLQQTLQMPQGYTFWLEWGTAELIWPQYWGAAPVPASILKNAATGLNMVKALNARPAKRAKYDPMLIRANRPDASFIINGGFR
jgi:hypothetical protein